MSHAQTVPITGEYVQSTQYGHNTPALSLNQISCERSTLHDNCSFMLYPIEVRRTGDLNVRKSGTFLFTEFHSHSAQTHATARSSASFSTECVCARVVFLTIRNCAHSATAMFADYVCLHAISKYSVSCHLCAGFWLSCTELGPSEEKTLRYSSSS